MTTRTRIAADIRLMANALVSAAANKGKALEVVDKDASNVFMKCGDMSYEVYCPESYVTVKVGVSGKVVVEVVVRHWNKELVAKNIVGMFQD